MFRFTITELKYRTLCVRKTWRSFLKSSAADDPFMSKRKRQNDFLASCQFGHLVVLTHESNQMTAQFCQNLTQFGHHKSDQLKLFDQRQSLK